MSLIRMHYARGEVSDRSFKCLDLTFFQEKEKSHYNPHRKEGDVEEEKKGETNGTIAAAVDYARLG